MSPSKSWKNSMTEPETCTSLLIHLCLHYIKLLSVKLNAPCGCLAI